jgi:serine/threonine protein kinase
MPKPLETGDPRALGRFELLARLGEGGQGIVYLGRGPGPGEERVAVKVLRSTADASVLERLARELDAIHHVQPFVTASVIEASADGERRYIVSEFIDGPSLQERVDTRGPLPEGELQRLAVGTATALTAIHGAGVVHRDFKPANVLLGPDGPRVVDFGIARLIDAATMTSGGDRNSVLHFAGTVVRRAADQGGGQYLGRASRHLPGQSGRHVRRHRHPGGRRYRPGRVRGHLERHRDDGRHRATQLRVVQQHQLHAGQGRDYRR